MPAPKPIHVGKQTILQGDCRVVLPTLPAKHFDVIVTSPPYRRGKPYDDQPANDRMPWGKYLDLFLEDAGPHLRTLLKDNGSLFLVVGSAANYPTFAIDIMHALTQPDKNRKPSWWLQNCIIWVKNISIRIGDDWQDFGGFERSFPLDQPRFLSYRHEFVFHLTKDNNTKLDRRAIAVPGKKNPLKCRGNVWLIPTEKVDGHPAPFPVELAETCIRLHGVRPGLRVLDPFVGSGSTLLACQRLKVAGTGIDLYEKYCQLAQRRLNEDAGR